MWGLHTGSPGHSLAPPRLSPHCHKHIYNRQPPGLTILHKLGKPSWVPTQRGSQQGMPHPQQGSAGATWAPALFKSPAPRMLLSISRHFPTYYVTISGTHSVFPAGPWAHPYLQTLRTRPAVILWYPENVKPHIHQTSPGKRAVSTARHLEKSEAHCWPHLCPREYDYQGGPPWRDRGLLKSTKKELHVTHFFLTTFQILSLMEKLRLPDTNQISSSSLHKRGKYVA